MPFKNSRFIDDFYEQDMLYGLTVRASIPRGKILSITNPKLPDRVGIISAKDIPGKNIISVLGNNMPVLAEDQIKYKGEPILLLFGPDEKELNSILNKIVIQYQTDYTLNSFNSFSSCQIAGVKKIKKGNPDRAFLTAFKIIEGEYRTSPQEHFYNDLQGAFCTFEANKMVLYSSTQWPFHVRNSISTVLGIPKNKITVRASEICPPFDGKIWYPSLIASHAALISWKTDKSVKFILSKDEDIRYTTKRSPSIIKYRTGLTKEGIITAQEINVHIDAGAYPLMSEELLSRLCVTAAGAYKSPNVLVKGKIIITSSPPMDAFSGLGLAQAFFGIEIHASRIAQNINTDPYLWRIKNLLKQNDSLITGGIVNQKLTIAKLLEHVVKKSDFQRKYAAYKMQKTQNNNIISKSAVRGIGLSVCYQGNGFLGKKEEEEFYSVTVRMDKEGRIFILTSGVSDNNGCLQIWRNIAVNILDIKKENIFIVLPDTSIVPDSGPSIFSRNIVIISNLIEKCCESIKKKRFRAPLPIEVKRSSKLPKSFNWNKEKFKGSPFNSLSWSASVVEVELDPVTLKTVIRGIWTAVDCGKIYDQKHARSSIETGIIKALHWCTDYIDFPKSSVVISNNLNPVWLKTAPSISIDFLNRRETPPGGLDELPASTIAPSYASAVSQAAGTYFYSIPVTPEHINQYMKDNGGNGE